MISTLFDEKVLDKELSKVVSTQLLLTVKHFHNPPRGRFLLLTLFTHRRVCLLVPSYILFLNVPPVVTYGDLNMF